jgi:protoporphyrinogen oxidase
VRPEKSLEDFFVNRFGRVLYETFFKDYTEKVWGVDCGRINADWGAQRVKGLSIGGVLKHAARKALLPDGSLGQKGTETSLIERFLYPKFGPGQMWEEVASKVSKLGGQIRFRQKVVGVKAQGGKVTQVTVKDMSDGRLSVMPVDYFFSTMPVQDLIRGFEGDVPAEVRRVAEGLVYRDFITVGLLLRKIHHTNRTRLRTINNIIPDNWIYVQERDVRLGRITIFNNWSPYLVSDPNKVWAGLEYFCQEGDDLWSRPDEDIARLAIGELVKIGFIDRADALDSVVIRYPKTYPAYFGTYGEMGLVRGFVDRFENLFLIGRNGMHRYNNMDHSMLTAMEAVQNITLGRPDKENIWSVNAEQVYHESRA